MFRKFKVLIVIASLAITLSLMSNTYSRYVASSQGNVEIEFAKWQILVNNTDITNNTSSNIEFTPTINKNNTNVAQNKVAPASTGYFDVEIDPTNVDVSFNYKIELGIENNENIPDLTITKYAVVPEGYIEGDGLTEVTITDGTITNAMNYEAGGFKKITLRIFFQWFEGEGEKMDDAADTNIGYTAATESTTFTINANIQFEQIIS